MREGLAAGVGGGEATCALPEDSGAGGVRRVRTGASGTAGTGEGEWRSGVVAGALGGALEALRVVCGGEGCGPVRERPGVGALRPRTVTAMTQAAPTAVAAAATVRQCRRSQPADEAMESSGSRARTTYRCLRFFAGCSVSDGAASASSAWRWTSTCARRSRSRATVYPSARAMMTAAVVMIVTAMSLI